MRHDGQYRIKMTNFVFNFARDAVHCTLMKYLALLVILLTPVYAQFVQQGPKKVGTGILGNHPYQGTSVALSADGNTALVGGYSDNENTGAVWVWNRSGDVWTQGPKLVGAGAEGTNVYQGYSVALSADGNTALVGGPGDSRIVDPNDPTKNTYFGATWVFVRNGGVWTQQGQKLVGSGGEGLSDQGVSVALSADGNTALIGGDTDGGGKGAVWVWTRNGGFWTQQGQKLVGSGAVGPPVYQGYSVSLSADGATAVVGAMGDNDYTGAVWVFTRTGSTWTQQGPKLVGSDVVGPNFYQGYSVDVSADGATFVVGRPVDNGTTGAAWVFTRNFGAWAQQGSKLVGTGAVGAAEQGVSVALSADGSTALVGGPLDNNSQGAAWPFTRSAGVWSQLGQKLVGSNGIGAPLQGKSVDLSGDAKTALVGGPKDGGFIGAAWVFTASVGCSCDVNGDGVINLGDVGAIIVQFLNSVPASCHSGSVNLADVGRVINAFLGKGCAQ